MANPYQKPQPGDPPKRSARFDAELVDVVRYVKGLMATTGQRTGATQSANGVIDIRNDSEEDVDRFGILGLDDLVFTPTDSLGDFQASPLYSGVVPVFPDHDGNFCVALDPIASGKIGKARVAGLVCVQIAITSGLEWYDHADVTDEDASKLTLLPAGAAQVLWKEEGTGTKWAIVRLGVPRGNVTLRMKLDEELAAEGSATASVWKGDPLADTEDDCTLYAGESGASLMSEGSSFDADKFVFGTWFPDSRKWEIGQAGC